MDEQKVMGPEIAGVLDYDIIRCSHEFDFASALQKAMDDEHDTVGFDDVATNFATPSLSSMDEMKKIILDSAVVVSPCVDRECPTNLKRSSSKSQSGSHTRRKKQRQEEKAKKGHTPKPEVIEQHVKQSTTIVADLDLSSLPVTCGAYTSKNIRQIKADEICTKEHLVKDYGFKSIDWNGRDPKVVIDGKDRVFMALAGRPDDIQYEKSCKDAFECLLQEGKKAQFADQIPAHRRGHFPVINAGVSHGMGSGKPFNIDNHPHTELVDRLVGHNSFRRLAGFASASFAAFSPKVYSYYRENLERVFDHDPGLERLFPSHISVYPAAAFNFGPNVWTYKHKDLLNCPFGWCAIQALGSFDPTKGGQLVLWEAKLVIDFPAGSLILLPSSIITHSNIPVAMGDNRASFTQYAAGGLFRYVDYNYCTEKQLKKNNPNLWKQILEKRVDNWKIGCALISSLDELRN